MSPPGSETSNPHSAGEARWRLAGGAGIALYRSHHHDPHLIGYEWPRIDGRPIRRTCPGAVCWLDGSTWMRDEDWPSRNHNDGEWGGMPRTLRKLWERCPWARPRRASPHPISRSGRRHSP